MFYFIAAVLVLLAVVYYKKTHKTFTDIDVPTPTVLRKDLSFCFYGCVGTQPEETKDCVNLFWESQFDGLDKAMANIKYMAMPTVLDVYMQCFTRDITRNGKNFVLNTDAKEQLIAVFNAMRVEDVLKYVKYIAVMDEPNTNVADEATLVAAVNIVKKVIATFPELEGVKLLCIYAPGNEPQIGFYEFDIVGFDDYDKKSTIFADGTYAAMKAKLSPTQQTIILPGGGFGQNPTPFINFAHNNPEVAIICAFVWFGKREPADTWIGIGNPANPLKQQYIECGKEIKNLSLGGV